MLSLKQDLELSSFEPLNPAATGRYRNPSAPVSTSDVAGEPCLYLKASEKQRALGLGILGLGPVWKTPGGARSMKIEMTMMLKWVGVFGVRQNVWWSSSLEDFLP